jgi:fibronectin type 3 domain-containing protein
VRAVRRVLLGLAVAPVAALMLVDVAAGSPGSDLGLQFNGSNQYVTFGAAPNLGASTFTLEVWFKRTGAGIGTTTGTGGIGSAIPLVTKGRGEAERSNVDMNYFLGIDAATGVLVADFEEGATGADPGLNHPVSGTSVIANNTWYHAAATYDGQTWRLYLNGAEDGTVTLSAAVSPRLDSIQHAALATAMNSTGVAAGYFQGVLDEARIWNYARTQQQIMSALNTEITSAPGLLGRWGMNDGAGTVVGDSSGNGANGTAANAPSWVGGYPFNPAQAPVGDYALDLSGSNSYVTFGPAPDLGASTFTLETWFKPTGAGSGAKTGDGGLANAIPLITKGRAEEDGSTRDMNYFLGIDASSGKLVADFEDMATGANHPVTGNTVISRNVWHHAAATYDGTTWMLYLDGAPDGQLTVDKTPRSDSVQHAALGTALDSKGVRDGFFQGAIDETRIWNYARSAGEIVASKDSEIGSGPGLVGRWGLNEGSGFAAGDSSGGGTSGRVFNGKWVGGALDTTPPEAPQGLAATAGVEQMTLSWTANSEPDLAGYDLYRSTSSPVATTGPPLNGGTPITGTSYVDSGLTAGVSYHYALRAVDGSGNASAIPDEVSGTAMTPVPGTFALSFDGSSQYVTFGASLGAPLFTLETWFKRTGVGAGTNTGSGGIGNAIPLITKGRAEADGSNVDMNYFLGIDASSGKLVADFEDMATGANHPVTGQTTVSQNVWHHAAATYDGSYWRLYLDGVLDARLAVKAEPRADSIQHAALATAMNSAGAAAGYFQGALDEARIWNYARSGSQIRVGKNAEQPSASGLTARLGLNEGAGTTATNSAGAPNGAINGTANWITGFDFPQNTTIPAAPQGLTATSEADSIGLAWAASGESDLAGYDLYRPTSSPVDTSGTPLNGSDLIQGTNFNDSAVTPGTTYYYALVAVDSAENRSAATAEVSAAPPAGDPVLVGAGDIGDCTASRHQDTADLINGIPGAVFTIGDNTQVIGQLSEYTTCYEQSWGAFKDRTRTAPGNHDFGGDDTGDGAGYFDYFNGAGNFTGPAGDRDKGYYSYDVGDYWHVVSLNSECGLVSWCTLAAEEQWLRSDLAGNRSKNVIAILHRPRWSSGASSPGQSRLQPLWRALFDYGVELLLDGHDHHYERFAPQNADGQLDTPHGVREIIVGTGGAKLSGVGTPVANSEVRNASTWGVLKLTLHPSSFDWRFIPIAGASFTDSGTDRVHEAPVNAPPTASVSLNTTAPHTNDVLTATATKTDPDGQPVTLTYTWKVNGEIERTFTSATALTDKLDLSLAGNGDKADEISVEVTPNDGIADGTATSASATVANAEPVFNQNLADRSDLEGTAVSFSAAASDADSDALTYEASGLPRGISINTSSGLLSGTIADDAAAESPHHVAISVRDGSDVDATDTFTWTVEHTNHAPVVDYVTVDNQTPATNDTLTAQVQAHDPDNDPLTYGYQWTNNGIAILGATEATLGLSAVGHGDKGDQIAVEVTANDGNTDSGALASDTVTVINTAPAATVALDDHTPRTDALLTATATKRDADGDSVSLTFVWKTDGVIKRTLTSATALSDTFDLSVAGNGDAGQTVSVEVTPSDGETGSPALDSVRVTVDTTPPAAPTGLVSTVTSLAVSLDWADNREPDLAGYDVYRGGSSGGPYTQLNTTLLTTSDYRDTSAPPGATSYYVVKAVDTSGNASAPSAELTVDRGIVFSAAATGKVAGEAGITLSRPTGTANGDVLLAAIDVLAGAAPSPPTGWTLVRSDSSGSTITQAVYIHVLTDAEPPSYTWTFASAQNASGVIVAYAGVDTETPIAGTAGAAKQSSISATAPSLSTDVSNTLLAAVFGAATNAGVTPPPEMLEKAEIIGGASNKRTVTEVADQPAPGAGSTGSRTATLSKAAANVAQLIALRPAGAPGPQHTAPGAPQNLTANGGDTNIHLAWDPPASDGGTPVTGLQIYRSTTQGAEKLIATIGVASDWSDTSVSNGTTYYYKVAAVNSVGPGTLSAEVSATPAKPPASAPTAPQALTASVKGKAIALSWLAPASDGGAAITEYIVYRSSPGEQEHTLGVVRGTTSYKDTTVTTGRTYYYTVAAHNSAGYSQPSAQATASLK